MANGTIEGTSGNDQIDSSYTGDVEGDVVDGNDASAPGQTGDEDIVQAGDGNDTIDAASGNDTVYAGNGADSVVGSTGHDTVFGGAGDDEIDGDLNMLVNGDLEAGQNNNSWSSYTSIPGWQNANGDIEVWGNGFQEIDSTDGGNFVEIDRQGGTDTLFQDVQTVSGTTYSVDFKSIQRVADSTETIEVYWNGVLVGSISPDGNTEWTDYSFEVVGTGGLDRLEFRELASENSGMGPFLDQISMTEAYDDELFGGAGDDTLTGGGGDDVLDGGDDNDLLNAGSGDDTLFGGAGADTMYAGTGNDTIFGGDGNDTMYGGAGDDDLNGGDGDDELFGGDGQDTLTGAAGNDTLSGNDGSDKFNITDDHDGDTIIGGEDADGSDVDTLGFYNSVSTEGVTVTATAAEAGTYDFDDTTGAGTFSEIEAIETTTSDDTVDMSADGSGVDVSTFEGDDSIIGGAGDDTINAGDGADTVEGGAGNDSIDVGDNGAGGSDGDPDVVVLQDGFGNDTVTNFDAPTANGDGTFNGIDTLDVSGLQDASGDPVNVFDVTVTDDGSGNAVLTFPNLESITLDGISPIDANDPFYLSALGIPYPDGTVEGTAGNDTIDSSYAGDPNGDFVDAGDAILPGDTGDDDLIYGYGGNDSIQAGAGADEVYGGSGDDTINAGTGDDTVFAGSGDDDITVASGTGTDDIEGGEDAGSGDVDTLNFTDANGTEGVDVVMTDDEDGTYDFPTDGGSGTFAEIEQINLTDQYDSFEGAAASSGNTVDGGAGNDVMSGSAGSDSFDGGSDDDIISGLGGEDTIEGGDGNDIIAGDAPAPIGGESAGNAGQLYLDVANVEPGSETGTPGDAQVGDSVVFNDAATLPDGTIVSVKVTVASISDPDVTVDLTEAQTGAPLRVNGNGDPSNAGSEVQFTMEFFDQLTGEPIVIGGQATVTDIDNNAGAGEEYVSFSDNDVTDYTVSPGSSITPSVGGGTVTGTGTTTNNANDQDAWFGVGFEDASQLTMTVGVVENTANYGFSGSDITNGVTTTVVGGADDSLSGGAGDDLIYGNGGDDIIDGGADEDTLYGGAGQDTLTGGEGVDTIVGGADQDAIYGGPGDVVDGSEDGVDSDTLYVAGVSNIIYDVSNPENGMVEFINGPDLVFTNIENVIITNDGTVSGTAGNDLIDDNYTGDPNGDVVDGGDAILPGDSGDDDLIEAGAGDDSILAGNGVDEVYAGADNDTVNGGLGNDTIFGEDGNDVLVGDQGNDTIFGGAGDDTIGSTVGTASGGNDTLHGGTGDDTIFIGNGGDTAFGGDDADTFNSDGSNYSKVVEGGEGGDDNDTLSFADEADAADTIDLSFTGDEEGVVDIRGQTVTFSEIENIVGTQGDDSFDASGSTGDTNMSGEAGDDTFTTGTGDDTFDGGDDRDTFTIQDNFGNDTIVGGQGGDNYDTLDLSALSNPVNVVFTGPGAGTVTDTVTGDVITFSEIEFLITTNQDDVVDATLDDGYTYVNTLAGEDSYLGSSGDDVIDDEAGNADGAGNDTFFGGGGDDLIWAGDDNDTVFGGTGNDTLNGQDGDDVIDGGLGNDTAFGGSGDDIFYVDDNDGTNTITGGETGETDGDTLLTISPTDVTVTSSGDEAGVMTQGTTTTTFSEIETINTDAGNDTVSIANDTVGMTVITEDGNDNITGGSGDDTIDAGSGDDTVTFAEGDDVDGGSGDDLFVLEDLGEPTNGTITIDGGAGDETGGDTLQLGGLAVLTDAVKDTFVDDGSGSFSGSVTLDDGTILNFSEIENIICFTPRTRIATPQGLVAVEDLEVGDLVVTRDHGLQPIRWIEGRTVPAVDRFAPVTIRKNVLAGQDRDLIVSPQHRVLFQGYRAELLFGESEVLIAAMHLVDGIDVTQDEADEVAYVHFLFDQHEIVFAEGAATESFHPGDLGFTAVGNEAREELFAIFPELRIDPRSYGATARRCLRKHEAQLIRL